MPHDESRPSPNPPAPQRNERQQAEREIAFRLDSKGVHLNGRETDEELVELLDAVEHFERVVERHGGDLMVDEPMDAGQAREPDNSRFLLPRRHDGESVRSFLDRITQAADRAAR